MIALRELKNTKKENEISSLTIIIIKKVKLCLPLTNELMMIIESININFFLERNSFKIFLFPLISEVGDNAKKKFLNFLCENKVIYAIN